MCINLNVFRKCPIEIYSVSGRHSSGIVSFDADIIKTGENLLVGNCFKCSRKKSMTVDDYSFNAEGLGNVFEIIGRTCAKSA